MNENDIKQAFARKLAGSLDASMTWGEKGKPAQEKRLAFYSKAFESTWDYISLDMKEVLSQDDYIIVGNEAQVLAEHRRIRRVLGVQVRRERKGYWRFEYAGHEHTLAYWEFHKAEYAIYGRIVKYEPKFHIDWKRP